MGARADYDHVERGRGGGLAERRRIEQVGLLEGDLDRVEAQLRDVADQPEITRGERARPDERHRPEAHGCGILRRPFPRRRSLMERILILTADAGEELEVYSMLYRLREAGYAVDVAAPER